MQPIAWVAGATGYTGRPWSPCAPRTSSPTCTCDPTPLERGRTQFTALGATVEATPWELAPLTEALRRAAVTQVYALLGTTQARTRSVARAGAAPADYERVDVGLTRVLLARAS